MKTPRNPLHIYSDWTHNLITCWWRVSQYPYILTLHTSWNIYDLGQYLLTSVITPYSASLHVNYPSCYEMVFALNFPNAGMTLWSDFQSVKGEGPQGFGSLCQPPIPAPLTSDPDAYKSPPVELVWPHGRKYHLERSANWRAPRHPTSANEQAKWPRRRGREKSRSRLVERGSLSALTLCPGLRATSSSVIKGLSRSTMEKLNCKTLQGKLLLFLGVRGSVLICKQYPLFSWAPSLSSPSPSTLPPPVSLFVPWEFQTGQILSEDYNSAE